MYKQVNNTEVYKGEGHIDTHNAHSKQWGYCMNVTWIIVNYMPSC